MSRSARWTAVVLAVFVVLGVKNATVSDVSPSPEKSTPPVVTALR